MSNELILVVDDEPDILGLCERILAGAGYQVYTASSGSHAIRIARETPFDVALLDLQMPDADGITIFEAIKKAQPDTIGIVITGYPSMEAAIDALKQGMSGFVLKPFTPNELRQAVADALERRRMERDYARLQALIPLYELSTSLMTTVDIDVLLDQVVEMAVQETGADRASLMLERDGMLYIEAARGLPEDVLDTTATPVGEGIAGWVAQHGKPLLLDKSVSMPPELADALTRGEIASAVCVPLALQDRVIGVLNLSKLAATEAPFTPSDRDLITVLAGQVAIAIENARLFRRQQALTQELSQVNANLRALQQAATALTSRLSPDRVLQTILDGCTAVMADATIAIGLLDADSETIEVHLHHGATRKRETKRLELQSSERRALESQSRAREVLEERLCGILMEEARPASVGVIPLSAQDQLLGAMAVGAQQELTEADITTLTPFADQAAAAIANARLFTRLQQAYEEMKELDRLKNEHITTTARQLREPLSLIKVHVEILNRTAPEEFGPALSKLLAAVEDMETQIENLAKLRDLEVQESA
ncbi:MAG: response regulator [Chloroflexi bacterium]|nr:MAG: response regulator [Chloroflexota bacterium]